MRLSAAQIEVLRRLVDGDPLEHMTGAGHYKFGDERLVNKRTTAALMSMGLIEKKPCRPGHGNFGEARITAAGRAALAGAK